MKYYLEYSNGIMSIKTIDTTKWKVKKSGCGNWYRVSTPYDDSYLIEDIFDTIEQCIDWLGTYSKPVMFPNGQIKYIN